MSRSYFTRTIFVFLFFVATLGVLASDATAGGKPDQPSKIPYIVQLRIEMVESALQEEREGELPPEKAAALSDTLIKVSTAGELELMFHAARAVGDPEEEDLKKLGARIVISTADLRLPSGRRYPPNLGIIQAWVPHDRVEEAANLDWVVVVTPVEDQPPDTGDFESEGVVMHRADEAHAAGIDGTGVTVGVISDGVDHLADAVASGDLPAGVNVLDAGGADMDEGTAMLEIIHDMAPGAALAFHATGGSSLTHIDAMNELAAAGAIVITEDIFFFTQPVFQQGKVAFNAEMLAEEGVSIRSSAGNRGRQHAARVLAEGTGAGPEGYTGTFTDCSGDGPTNVVDIDPGPGTSFDVSIAASGTGQFFLQWSEPRTIFPTSGAGGFTDLDLYLMDAAGTTCLAESLDVQEDGNGDTIEIVKLSGPVDAKIVVNLAGGSGAVAPPLIDLRWLNATASAGDTPTRAGSLNPDSNYTSLATSSAAANANASADPLIVPLGSFSSGGPVHLESTTVCPAGYPCPGTSIAGPAPLIGGGPDWTAANGVSISGAGGFGSGTCPANGGTCRFFGTSAATPHAAACDALVRQVFMDNGLTPLVAQVNARLATTAVDRGDAGFDNEWGAGVLDCYEATNFTVGVPHMIILLDRTYSMTENRPSTGNSRCHDALELAKQDVETFFVNNPESSGSSVAVWTFADPDDPYNGPSIITAPFVGHDAAMAVLEALGPEDCSGNTPLAEAICTASDSLNLAFPDLGPVNKIIAVSSDGEENVSEGECKGNYSHGGPPYDDDSWQEKVWSKVLGQNVVLARYWGTVVKSSDIDAETGESLKDAVLDSAFFRDLAEATGGLYQGVRDNAPLPPSFFAVIPILSAWGFAIVVVALVVMAGIYLHRRRLNGIEG